MERINVTSKYREHSSLTRSIDLEFRAKQKLLSRQFIQWRRDRQALKQAKRLRKQGNNQMGLNKSYQFAIANFD